MNPPASVLAAMVLLVAAGLAQAQGQVQVNTGGGVAAAANAKIDAAAVNPAAPLLAGAADFSATARNTGNTAGNISIRITITPPAGGGLPFLLTNTTANKAAGASLVLAQVGCGNCTAVLGKWTVLVEALTNGTVTDRRQFDYMVNPAPVGGAGGAAGGGGGAVPQPAPALGSISAPTFRDVAFLRQPVVIELRPGEVRESDFLVANNRGLPLTLQVQTLLPEEWAYFPQKAIGLPSKEKAFLKQVLSPPKDAPPGDYRVAVKLSEGGQVVAETFAILRVKTPAPGLSAPSALRVLDVDTEKNQTRVNLVVRSGERPVPKLEVEEKIPKSLAARVSDISFATPPEILDPDPWVKWTLLDLLENETRTLTYTLPGVRSEWSPYIYFPVDKVTASYEEAPPAFKVEAFSETLYQGAPGRLKATFESLLKTPQRIAGRLDAPSPWKVEPKEFTVELPALDRREQVFALSVPRDAPVGTQSLIFTLSSEGSRQVVSFDVVVRPGGWDWWLIFLVAAAIAVAALVVRAITIRYSRWVFDRIIRLEALRRVK